jgi:type II secretory pathway pseudopilin PulG
MKSGKNKKVGLPKQSGREKQQGFTLIETVIAMVVMMIVGLGAASLFVYAIGHNSDASNRALSMSVAQQQMEQLRKTAFVNLAARVTEMGGADKTVTSDDGRQYRVVTTIADTVTGDARRKTITVRVAPLGTNTTGLTSVQHVYGGVTLVTERATPALGPNLGM